MPPFTHQTPLHRKAFSLVELLVVIACIAVLAGILIPVINAIREKSRTTQCANNMRQLGMAFSLYSAENNMQVPNQPSGVVAPGYNATYWERLAPYAGYEGEMRASDEAARGTVMHCPNHTEWEGAFSYFANRYLFTPTDDIRVNAIEEPSDKILFYEVHTRMQWPIASYYGAGTGKSPFFPAFTHHAHDGGSNFVFVDGHVEFTDKSLNYQPDHWLPN